MLEAINLLRLIFSVYSFVFVFVFRKVDLYIYSSLEIHGIADIRYSS
jgi:hypothetical protein